MCARAPPPRRNRQKSATWHPDPLTPVKSIEVDWARSAWRRAAPLPSSHQMLDSTVIDATRYYGNWRDSCIFNICTDRARACMFWMSDYYATITPDDNTGLDSSVVKNPQLIQN